MTTPLVLKVTKINIVKKYVNETKKLPPNNFRCQNLKHSLPYWNKFKWILIVKLFKLVAAWKFYTALMLLINFKKVYGKPDYVLYCSDEGREVLHIGQDELIPLQPAKSSDEDTKNVGQYVIVTSDNTGW